MIVGQKFYQELNNLEQEVLDLKQIKQASSASKYYSKTGSSGSYHNYWRITYKDGTQPIISEVLSYSDTALSTPVGNQQYLFSYSQATTSVTVLSTREIDSIIGL
jgi:hypothetical protein